MMEESLRAPPGQTTRGRATAVHIDSVSLALVLALLLLGLVMVTSASISIASQDTGNPFYYLERQLLTALVGTAGAVFVFCFRMKRWERLSRVLLAAAVIMLLAVLVPGLGEMVNGGRRWLRLAGFSFQVSELARVLVLIYVASYAARRQEELRETFTGLVKPLLLLGLVALLLLGEPDFGAATVLFATGFGMLFIAGARLRYVVLLTAVAAALFAVLAVTSAYRLRRLTGFLDPWANPYSSGFQLTQSLIAIGRGKWLGVGLGNSVQKLFYLPEAHTDFLFAVLAEELGLLGVLLTLGLFVALVWRSFYIARLASQAGLDFQSYLAAGFGLWIGIQAFINIGVNMGVLPTKGLTLPLMSYGRSSLIVTLGWVGMLLRVYHETMMERRGSATVMTGGFPGE
ncbi:MAG TPA: putative lipid II flippase FtsW [Steroidobacteraceae bacterium]